ncbi:DNA cytosine methyltransferase [Nocardia arthritidis]|uniref:DNA (cytosine-5-)-methyltransferase n=1 Tax=Nocardia arthritidis TaxID=228602 RepID=A0A6G9YBH0_9NOCA|nr:DNA cytosine methyltransferase [Nocardia arthritidis]QIS10615.1 DNA cytosine methyltransferase [Nocardia arthritidis]
MLTVTDLFCGAGGSTSGAVQVAGVRVRMAANHWRLAIETHNENHPETDHDCADISQVDPRRYPRTDLLWASPECTNHSQARGRKRNVDATPDLFGEILPDEAAERSRATMWDVVRFTEFHRYRGIIVENVVDAAKWVLFSSWLHAMDALGYSHRTVYLNSMHAQAAGAPAPQSRDRVYVVFWRRGDRTPDLEAWTRPKAWCPQCDRVISAVQAWKDPVRRWGRYRAQYVWRCPNVTCRNTIVEPDWLPAATVIDWSLRGQRIGDRDKPLAAKTVARIEAGLARFGDESFLSLFRSGRVRNFSTTDTLATVVADGSNHALLVPTGGTWRDQAVSVAEPMPTRTTRENDALLVPVEGRDGKQAQPVTVPMRTMTTRSETGVLVSYYGHETAHSTMDPHGTVPTRDRWAVVVPLRNHNTAKSTAEPLDTVAAAGNHHGLANPVTPRIEDCEFRMLEPSEIKQAMAFDPDYVMHGNRREQVRLAGNAVTPPAARDLISAVAEALGQQVS